MQLLVRMFQINFGVSSVRTFYIKFYEVCFQVATTTTTSITQSQASRDNYMNPHYHFAQFGPILFQYSIAQILQ